MYDKIKKIGELLTSCKPYQYLKYSFFLGLILILCNCIYLTYTNSWKFCSYPEEEYKLLEEEATWLVSNHTFDTEYDYTITNYNSKSKILEFDLTYETSTNIALITVTVDNYNTKNESVNIERKTVSTFYTIKRIFLFVLLLPMLIAVALIFFVVLLYVVAIWFIAYILHIIIQYLKNKK